MEEQVVAIYAGVNGFLDDVPTEEVPRFQDELREFLRAEGAVYQRIKETGELDEETEQQLRAQIEKFKNTFAVAEETAA
jgi:F-type H+-transporting ATPase subunit alpha